MHDTTKTPKLTTVFIPQGVYFAWLCRYKSMIESNFSINGERLVAACREHAMFTFVDLKVTSHYDRQTK